MSQSRQSKAENQQTGLSVATLSQSRHSEVENQWTGFSVATLSQSRQLGRKPTNRDFCGYNVTRLAIRSLKPMNGLSVATLSQNRRSEVESQWIGLSVDTMSWQQIKFWHTTGLQKVLALHALCIAVCAQKHRPQTMYACTGQHIYIHTCTDCKLCTKHRPVYVHNIHTDHVYNMYTQTMAGSHLHGTVCALCYHMKLFYPDVNTLLFYF